MNNRWLDNWVIVGVLANDRKTWIYSLAGRTIREADGTTPAFRLTSTSPIKSFSKGVVTTASGSTYKLCKPDPEYGFSNEDFVGANLNPWLDGDNWLTI